MRRRPLPCYALGALAIACGATALLPAARADTVAEFYRGNQVTIQVGFGVGGGYDTMTRLFAPYFGKHIPGSPSVVVQNVPGAGSMNVANTIFNNAANDGLMLGVFASSTALEPLFGNKNAAYDPRRFEWVGSLHRDIASCGVWKGGRQGIKSLPDLRQAKSPVLFGSTSPTAITSQHVLFLKNMLGANVKVVYGYKGTKDVSLAMMRGEVDGSCGMLESSLRSAFEQHLLSGELKIVVQFGRERVPYFGDATPMYDVFKSKDEEMIADVIFRQTELARPLAAPPGTAKERIAALRKAMLDALQDPGLIDSARRMQISFDPISGEETADLFAAFYRTPPQLIELARRYTQPEPR
jgi:tripartite-type tricarboxylate transporter receptor subunit TctC